MEINGIAHVMLTAGDYPRTREFYRKLLPFLGLHALYDTDERYYAVGGRTAFGVQACDPAHQGGRFVQGRVGLHHVCFRARSREDVDAVHALAVELGATVVHSPEEASFAPGYYSTLFEDPDGVRLEVNFVPGRGHLDALKSRDA
jgi:catechol 2,3-dioxygenase-like lactoylglutathione lyase family enzyme